MRLIGQRADYCFFVASQVFGNLHPDIGTGVSINARLMEAGATVPYLAACVWDQVREIHQRGCQFITVYQHEYVGPSVMDFLIAPPMPEHVECYYRHSEELHHELEAEEARDQARERKRSHSVERPLSEAGGGKRMQKNFFFNFSMIYQRKCHLKLGTIQA